MRVILRRPLTVELRGRPRVSAGRRGRTIFSGARGANQTTHHGPLQRLLGPSLTTGVPSLAAGPIVGIEFLKELSDPIEFALHRVNVTRQRIFGTRFNHGASKVSEDGREHGAEVANRIYALTWECSRHADVRGIPDAPESGR